MNPGHLQLRVLWDGFRVTGVDIGNSRPQSFRLLYGRPPDEARILVPLLFSACRHGQSAAARAALASAQGYEPMDDGIALAAEAAQGHLWRLLLDWPKALGYPADLAGYSTWHKRLGEVAAQGDWSKVGAELKAFCECNFFGMDAAAWLNSDGSNTLTAPHGKVLLDLEESGPATDTAFLPADLPARDYYQAMLGDLDSGYARYPTWNGAAAETGPYARWHGTPPVAASGSRIAGRVQARLAELATLSLEAVGQRPLQLRCDGYSPEPGCGFALAETARGLLIHWVRLESGRIADYLIVAPTEWNFHPGGAFRRGMADLEARDVETVERRARHLALALDPCVPYDVDVSLQ